MNTAPKVLDNDILVDLLKLILSESLIEDFSPTRELWWRRSTQM